MDRTRSTLELLILAVALIVALPGYGDDGSAPADTGSAAIVSFEFPTRSEDAESIVGWRSWQEVRMARTDWHLANLHAESDLRTTLLHEKLEDAVIDCYEKYYRDRIEDSLEIEVHFPGGRAPSQRSSVSVSPRVKVGDRSYIGVRVRPRGRDGGFFSRLSVEAGRRLDGAESEIALRYDANSRYVRLKLVESDVPERESISLSVKWVF